MDLRKLFPRILVTTLAFAICSTSATAQTRPRTTMASGDINEVTCSPDEFAVLTTSAVADSKPVWEAKPKPTIDLAPSIGSSSAGFLKFEPTLMAAIDQR